MSQVTKFENLDLDAFDLYIESTNRFGAYQVFLLDSSNGSIKTRYDMSLLGILPLIDIQVKSGEVYIEAETQVGLYLYDQLKNANFNPANPVYSTENSLKGKPSTIQFPFVSFIISGSPISVLDSIRKTMGDLLSHEDNTPFSCGFLGYFSYDAIQYLETLPRTVVDDRHLPDIRFQFHSAVVHLVDKNATLFSHADSFRSILSEEIHIQLVNRLEEMRSLLQSIRTKGSYSRFEQCLQPHSTNGTQIQLNDDVTKSVFQERVEKAKEYILSGDIFQVVLSKRVRVEKRIHPYQAYARLRTINPSPYMFMAEYPNMSLFGASPEVQFRAVDGNAQMKPIAGTSMGRGKNPEEDNLFRERLINNAKDTAEHIMLVDLCRNDLGRVCHSGTVAVDDLMTIEAYSHLFHLVSTVNGKLKKDTNIFKALLATYPAGTLSGAPKIRAMEIIDELEDVARGPYGGFVGMVDVCGNANTAIIIRSVVEVNDVYYVQAGAGIVADSDPVEEWYECGRKAQAIIQVLTASI